MYIAIKMYIMTINIPNVADSPVITNREVTLYLTRVLYYSLILGMNVATSLECSPSATRILLLKLENQHCIRSFK